MNFIVRAARHSLTTRLSSAMSKDVWKERDDGAEKVYITREESTFASIHREDFGETAQQN